MSTFGFIVLRHVNSSETNEYWMYSYDCIRKFYPDNLIVFIDDASDETYLTHKQMHNTFIIKSEFPKRGELLPYYYYSKYKFFDMAIILHDSVFINYFIDFQVDTYRMLWNFPNDICPNYEDQNHILSQLDNNRELFEFRDTYCWYGCFGSMCVIRHDYLHKINEKHDFSKLLPVVTNRFNRQTFERVISILLSKNNVSEAFFGYIRWYMPGSNDYSVRFSDRQSFNEFPLVKVWTGR